MRPITPGEQLPEHTSISDYDLANGSPKYGDMLAKGEMRDDGTTDFWLVSAEAFEKGYRKDRWMISPWLMILGTSFAHAFVAAAEKHGWADLVTIFWIVLTFTAYAVANMRYNLETE